MVKRCEGTNDLVKYCVLLCGDDEDPEICKAAAASLAMLTSQSNKLCMRIFDVSIRVFLMIWSSQHLFINI